MFYLFIVESGELRISPLINDKHIRGRVEVLLPSLPLGLAQRLLHEVDAQRSGSAQEGIANLLIKKGIIRRNVMDADWIKGKVLMVLQMTSSLAAHPWRWESQQITLGKYRVEGHVKENLEPPDINQQRDFQGRMEGRLLVKEDLQRLGQECGLLYPEVLALCQDGIRRGEAEWIPAVIKDGRGWRCQRCGETEVEEWTSIYGPEATCPACASLGAVSSLHALYRSVPSKGDSLRRNLLNTRQGQESSLVFSPRWELSDAQKQAAQEVLDFVKEDPVHIETTAKEYSRRETLLWAACGAGKTEVCFPAAAWALEHGQKVLFAAPRQDVVLDVAPRLLENFQGLKLSVLTGTSQERFAPAPFVLATTHQILRFSQAFDLIFLDEMDAFPYYGNEALVRGISQALRPGGKIIYLTATPSRESLEKVKQERMGVIRLPARHHRKAIPIPEWRKAPGGLEPERFALKENEKGIVDWIQELSEEGQVLLFVPKISWVNPWVEILQRQFPQWEIAGSYSADPRRREKIAGLRNKNYRLFVSTSILERGVTIPDAQVMVLGADHEVFDVRGLVQMAGRVGRTSANPTGRALFLASKKTSSIEEAIRWIKEQNELALARGLLD